MGTGLHKDIWIVGPGASICGFRMEFYSPRHFLSLLMYN
jgi:hypothetical protein